MLFLNWLFEEREHTWLTWLERPLAKAGRLDAMAVLVACLRAAGRLRDARPRTPKRVLFAGLLGLVVYLAVNGLGTFFENAERHR